MISVPFCKAMLEISVLRGWNVLHSSSENVLIKSPISFLLNIVFLKIGGKLAKFSATISGTSMLHRTLPKNFPPFYFFYWLLSYRWMSVRKVLSDMFFDNIICLVPSAPSTFPHFNDSETFSLYKASFQFIKLSFYYHVEYPLLRARAEVLDWDKSGKRSSLFWTQYCKKSKTVTLKQSNFFCMPDV